MKKNIKMLVAFAIIGCFAAVIHAMERPKDKVSQEKSAPQLSHKDGIDLITIYRTFLIHFLAQDLEKICGTEKKLATFVRPVDIAYQKVVCRLLKKFKINESDSMIPFHTLNKKQFTSQFCAYMVAELHLHLKNETLIEKLSCIVAQRFQTIESVEVACLAFMGSVRKGQQAIEILLNLQPILLDQIKIQVNFVEQKDSNGNDFYGLCRANALNALKTVLPFSDNQQPLLALVTACAMILQNNQPYSLFDKSIEELQKSFYELVNKKEHLNIRKHFESSLCLSFAEHIMAEIDTKKIGFKSFESIVVTYYLFIPYIEQVFNKK